MPESISEAEAREMLHKFQEARVIAYRDLGHAEGRIQGMTEAIRGLIKAFPDLAEEVDDVEVEVQVLGRPKGSDAVRQILVSQPNTAFSVNEMVQALNIRGWLPLSENPANAVRVALERVIAADDNMFFKSRGDENNPVRYYFQPLEISQTALDAKWVNVPRVAPKPEGI